MNIERQVQTIGKRTFVNCFEKTKRIGRDITNAEVAACDSPHSQQWDQRSLETKASTIRSIFQDGNECEALRLCFRIAGNSVSAQKARDLYERFCQRGG